MKHLAIAFLTLAAAGASALISPPARADSDLDAKRTELRDLKKRRKTAEQEIRARQKAVNDVGSADYQDSCNVACQAKSCEPVVAALGLTNVKATGVAPQASLCVRIFEADYSRNTFGFASAADVGGQCMQGPVAACELVKRRKDLREARNRLGDTLSDIDQANADLEALNDRPKTPATRRVSSVPAKKAAPVETVSSR